MEWPRTVSSFRLICLVCRCQVRRKKLGSSPSQNRCILSLRSLQSSTLPEIRARLTVRRGEEREQREGNACWPGSWDPGGGEAVPGSGARLRPRGGRTRVSGNSGAKRQERGWVRMGSLGWSTHASAAFSSYDGTLSELPRMGPFWKQSSVWMGWQGQESV